MDAARWGGMVRAFAVGRVSRRAALRGAGARGAAAAALASVGLAPKVAARDAGPGACCMFYVPGEAGPDPIWQVCVTGGACPGVPAGADYTQGEVADCSLCPAQIAGGQPDQRGP